MRRRTFIGTGAALAVAGSSVAQPADAYPQQPMKIVVAASPGGPADAAVRILTSRLQPRLGSQTPLVIDHRPGANSRVAGEFVAKATPNGTTLLVAAAGHAVNPALVANMSFDPLNDLVPVAMVSRVCNAFVSSAQVPAKTLKELMDWGRSNPALASYASGGKGAFSHLLAEALVRSAGVNFLHVPYKSGTAAVSDLVSGRVAFQLDTVQQMMPLVRDGKLNFLAVTSDRRWPALPDVPTVREAGYPEAAGSSWVMVFAPAKTPTALIERLSRDINTVMETPDAVAALQAIGMEQTSMTPGEADRFVRAEAHRWAKLIREIGIKPE